MSAFDRVLIIETSGKIGQVALANSSGSIAESRLGEATRRASDLALVAQRLLKERDWLPGSLTAVVVGLGPGSYTGLRVGLASAKALAYAAGCSFFGVETFAAIAHRAPAEVNELSVVGDALQGKLYHRNYRRNERGEWTPASELTVVSSAELLTGIQSPRWISGPIPANLIALMPADARLVETEMREARPIDLLEVAKRHAWAITTDMWTAEPYYLRGSSAEEKAAAGSSIK